jgi:hypothetical protein
MTERCNLSFFQFVRPALKASYAKLEEVEKSLVSLAPSADLPTHLPMHAILP